MTLYNNFLLKRGVGLFSGVGLISGDYGTKLWLLSKTTTASDFSALSNFERHGFTLYNTILAAT